MDKVVLQEKILPNRLLRMPTTMKDVVTHYKCNEDLRLRTYIPIRKLVCKQKYTRATQV